MPRRNWQAGGRLLGRARLSPARPPGRSVPAASHSLPLFLPPSATRLRCLTVSHQPANRALSSPRPPVDWSGYTFIFIFLIGLHLIRIIFYFLFTRRTTWPVPRSSLAPSQCNHTTVDTLQVLPALPALPASPSSFCPCHQAVIACFCPSFLLFHRPTLRLLCATRILPL